MFSGIIEGLGTLTRIRPSGPGKRLAIHADFRLDGSKIGDSIAVSGACLTAVSLGAQHFEVDVSPETLAKTTLGRAKVGERVNLERALRFSDRIDGHLVAGHVDGMGAITQRETLGNAIIVTVQIPESLARYMIPKGSVAVDGVSLTINTCHPQSFAVSIIPHTLRLTTLGFKRVGDSVNIETDMIGKYVERFVSGKPGGADEKAGAPSGIDMEFLARAGFI
ncbi:MAG: riboflavin synthase [Desulfobacterales bacterium]|nr:MAG: riboflavin synthase [Desulfobacterales bacterium]